VKSALFINETAVRLNGNMAEKITSSVSLPVSAVDVGCRGGMDDELHTFLNEFSACNDLHQTEQLNEWALKQWIARSKSRYCTDVLGYLKSGLPIAIKLTELLIREGDYQQNNGQQWRGTIPPASICAAKVSVKAKERGMNSSEALVEVIEDVSIKSSANSGLD